MNTPSQQQPEEHESWFHGIPRDGFPAPEQRHPASPWANADPLTGPLPAPERELGAPLAEQSEASVGGPEISQGYAPALQRQHAERVPRYIASSMAAPTESAYDPAEHLAAEDARPELIEATPSEASQSAPPYQAGSGFAPPASPESATERMPVDQATFERASADELVDQMRVDDPVFDAPGSTPEAPAPFQAGAPYQAEAAYQAAEPVESYTNALPTVPAPAGQPPAGPPPGGPATGQLPAGATAAQPYAARPTGQSAPEEPGIPPSLVPMLSAQDQGPSQPYGHRTEPIASGATYGGPQPAAKPAPRPGTGGSGNPAVVVAVALVTLLAVVPGVLLLYSALFDAGPVSASGTVSATLLLVGLPVLAAGLYPVISGSATAPDGIRGVVRPPLPYLVVGMVLLLAAGLAAS